MLPNVADDIADQYRERYIAYLDLLGFKSLVEKAESDPEMRERYVRC